MENFGAVYQWAALNKGRVEKMFTITDIISDIQRGIALNNMVEDCFSYRIIFFVNEGGKGIKHHVDTSYGDLRTSLENIIRGHLTVTNSIVIAQATALKNGQSVSLLGKAYGFSLDAYFSQIYGRCEGDKENRNNIYGRHAYAAG